MKDTLFKKAYNAYLGTKNESLAYDFWCKGWEAAIRMRNEEDAKTYQTDKDVSPRHYKAFR